VKNVAISLRANSNSCLNLSAQRLLDLKAKYSINCSGAIVIQDRHKPEHPVDYDPIHSIWATWTVPVVKPPPDAPPGEWSCTSWVGLGGGRFDDPQGSRHVMQAGIGQRVTLNGDRRITQTIEAFCGWDSEKVTITRAVEDFPLQPGDLIHVKVQYLEGQDKGLAQFIRYTRNKVRVSTDIPGPPEIDFAGDTGEWMLQRPCYDVDGKLHYYQLPDFGIIEFVHAGGLTADDVPISLRRAYLCRMGTDEGPRRIIAQANKNRDSVRITWKP
jgi:Peptidase A4 family